MILKELLNVLDLASDIVIYYKKANYKGCLEDMDFREEIKLLSDKEVMRIMPTRMTWHKEEYFDGNPYLEIELGD